MDMYHIFKALSMEYKRKGMRITFQKEGKEKEVHTDTKKEQTNRKKIHVNQKIIHCGLMNTL